MGTSLEAIQKQQRDYEISNTFSLYTDFYSTTTRQNMEAIISNPAFKHISDRIFLQLKVESLIMCRRVSLPMKRFVDNDYLWFDKLMMVKDQVLKVAKNHVIELLQIIPVYSEKQNADDKFNLLEFHEMLCAYLECFTFTTRKDPILAIGSSNIPTPGK